MHRCRRQTAAVDQILTCATGGSELKTGSKTTTFELAEEVLLDSGFEGDPWGIYQGTYALGRRLAPM